MKVTFSFTILCLCIVACKSPGNSEKALLLADSTYNRLLENCSLKIDNEKIVVYYFDGDCSSCIMKMMVMEEERSKKKDAKLVFLAKTLNPLVLRANLKQINIGSCVIIDSTDSFNNQLAFNRVHVVNKNREVVLEKHEEN